MASRPVITPHTEPQQPGLRSFIIYDRMPEGCIAFEVTDNRMAPHVRAGEFAVIDPVDREPMLGEAFLIEWSDGSRQVVEVGHHPATVSDGETLWMAGWTMTMRTVDGTAARTLRWGDGPYREDGIRQKLVGRVVGIYQPDFRAQLTLLAEVR